MDSMANERMTVEERIQFLLDRVKEHEIEIVEIKRQLGIVPKEHD